jgi:hypothetical protein
MRLQGLLGFLTHFETLFWAFSPTERLDTANFAQTIFHAPK